MRKYLILILFLFLNCSKKQKYVVIDSVKGKIISKKNGMCIEGAKIYGNKYASNGFDTIISKKDGSFIIDGTETECDYFEYIQLNRDLFYTIYINKEGYKTNIIDLKDYINENNHRLDTIDLGNIIFKADN